MIIMLLSFEGAEIELDACVYCFRGSIFPGCMIFRLNPVLL